MLNDKVNELESKLDEMKEWDRKFASSLVRSYRKNGILSQKQLPWVQKLIDRVNGAEKLAPRETEEIGGMHGLIQMFTLARTHLKHPAIRLLVDDLPVRLSMGIRGAGAGSVNVTDGGPYGNNKWYGRVTPAGTWTKGRKFAESERVGELLKEMSEDPVKTAQEYGKLTGRCCFCNRALGGNNDRSTDVGYGPICAEHYGLPWGNKA